MTKGKIEEYLSFGHSQPRVHYQSTIPFSALQVKHLLIDVNDLKTEVLNQMLDADEADMFHDSLDECTNPTIDLATDDMFSTCRCSGYT